MPHFPCHALPNDENDASSDFSEIFSNDPLDIASSDSSSASEHEFDSESEDDLALDDEEEQLPPEHYLQEAECLDVSLLRQKRYSPGTQEKLDETREYWDK